MWSLGVVLYELATGRKPFAGGNRRETVNAILSEEPVPATETAPELPAELDHVLLKALEKDRELRYQTASDLRADLKRLGREIDSSPSLNESGRKSSRVRRAAARARARAPPLLVITGLLLVALAAFVGWSYMKSREDVPDWSRAAHLQLTDQERTEFFPSLAPDGRTFVYSSDQSGNFDLCLQRVGGKNPTNLMKDSAADDSQPAFSPDGERIAFRSERSGTYEIWTMDAGGMNLWQITFNNSPNTSFPIWSPDGTRLLYRKESISYILDLNKSWEAQTPEQIPQPSTTGDFFGVWDWSPDGSKLAGTFAGPNGTGFGYYSFETRRFEKVSDTYALPYWLPDSRRVIFAHEGKAFIADTSNNRVRELLARTPEQIRNVAISRDGLLLYYTLLSTESDIWLLNLE